MYATNRWATKAQMNNRYAINLDEAFAEQWQETYG
jgi:glycine betaine/choline ABC-type transport system substrate-binding protein